MAGRQCKRAVGEEKLLVAWRNSGVHFDIETPEQVLSDQVPAFARMISVTMILCFALVFFALAGPLVAGRLYVTDDLGSFHIPIRWVYQTALQTHDTFLWAPQFFGGLYLHAEGQAGMYHPLHLLLYRTLSLQPAFSIELLLPYLVMFPGMYWFLRRLALPQPAALFGAFIFTFSGFNLLHFMHMNAIAIVAHIPWLLAAVDVLLRTSDRRQVALAQLFIALATASQLLLGYPQYVWFSLLAEIAFVLFRFNTSVAGWRLGAFALATVLGFLLGSVQLLPTIDALRASTRSDPSLQFRISFSLDPANLIQLWSPYGLNGRVAGENIHEFGLYNGSACTVALAWLFVRRRVFRGWRRLAVGCGIFAGTMLFLALGHHGGIYPIIARLPILGLFRAPSRYILLVQLALSILAAVMIADLLGLAQHHKRVVSWSRLWPLAIPVALSALTLAGYIWIMSTPIRFESAMYLSSFRRTALGMGLMVATTFLVVAAARGYRMAPLCVAVFAVADLSAWGLSYVWTIPPQDLQRFVERFPAPAEHPSSERIYVEQGSSYASDQNVLVMKGYRIAGGYVALPPHRELRLEDALSEQLLGVRWAYRDGRWLARQDALPRVRLVAKAAVSRDVAQDIQTVDMRQTVLVDTAVGDLTEAAIGTAHIVTDRPGFIEVAISSSGRQLLVLSESYHPGWKAAADGRRIPIYRAYGDLMACVVNKGAQRMVFSFEPDSIRWGLELSIGGGILAIASFLWCVLSGRIEYPPVSALAKGPIS